MTTDELIEQAIAEEEARIGHKLAASDRKAIATKIELVEEGAPQQLTSDGLLKSSPATIFTYGGGTIEPLDPNPDDITIEAIAHSLANQCRWTGHVQRFYSVAEHAVHCSKIVPTLECLLHDASEAYLADLARPVKKAPGLGEVYLECELRLEQAIAVKFGLEPPPMSPDVKEADDAMLKKEANQLVPHLGAIMPDPPEDTPNVRCWNPSRAELEFMLRYRDLGGKVQGRA